jgi:hypothetical protein
MTYRQEHLAKQIAELAIKGQNLKWYQFQQRKIIYKEINNLSREINQIQTENKKR